MSEVEGLEVPNGSFYGARYRGYLEAPTSGDYTFWIAGDDAAELWLGSDDSPFTRTLIAETRSYTVPEGFDEEDSQKSEVISLVAGERYYFEILFKQHAQESHLSVAWQINDGLRETILPSNFYSLSPHPEDVDDDDMRDSWETTHGFTVGEHTEADVAQLPYADPDNDFIPNFQEAALGTDPWVGQPLAGFLSQEIWTDCIEYTLEQTLANDTAIFRAAERKKLLSATTTGPNLGVYEASRARGYVVAPETGEYHFWLSARTSAELFLSSGELPYQKERICRLSPEVGTVDGVPWSDQGDGFFWDTYSQQMSSPVYLEAGQKYYLEVLFHIGSTHTGHYSLAWARPNADREVLPTSVIESFAVLPEDADDDSLPDQWEIDHGLDATDNGLTHRLLEGERGDLDADGLNNREEYLYGTDPNNPDSDGDGLTDAEEIRSMGTDPLLTNSVNDTVVEEISVGSFSSSTNSWIALEDGFISSSFRGEVSWDFSVPTKGPWILSLDTRLHGELLLSEELDVTASVDGVLLKSETLLFTPGSTTNLRLLTPLIDAGSHELTLTIDNYSARRTLEVANVQVIKPGGLDLDSSGIADWVEAEMENRSGVRDHVQFSYVSPFFIEGNSLSSSLVDLTLLHRSGQRNRKNRTPESQWTYMLPGFENYLSSYENRLRTSLNSPWYWGRMEGEEQTVLAGAGHGPWYAYLDLDPNEAVGYVALFENLGHSERHSVVWTAYNVLDGGQLTIPLNSELLLSGWTWTWDSKNVTLDIDGQIETVKANKTHRHLFDQPGTFQITATHQQGATGTLTVEVVGAEIGDRLNAAEQNMRTWDMPDVPLEVSMELPSTLNFSARTALGLNGSTMELHPLKPGVHRVAARIGADGPILDTGEVNVIGYGDALRHDSDRVIAVQGDYFVVQSPFLMTNLPPGGYAVLTIFRAGVSFADGTTVKTITEADLDANGVVMINFLFPSSSSGGSCHYVDFYDADGNRLNRR